MIQNDYVHVCVFSKENVRTP